MSDLNRCYELLGLRPGASPGEFTRAYQVSLASANPAKLPNRMLSAAVRRKIAEIKAAYQKLAASVSGSRSPESNSTQTTRTSNSRSARRADTRRNQVAEPEPVVSYDPALESFSIHVTIESWLRTFT